MTHTLAYSAVILAGGEARRLGGQSKALLDINGTALIEYALAAAQRATRSVVVGPVTEHHPASLTTREDPPGGGPVAGLAAGLELVDRESPWILVLACDVPRAEGAVRLLESAILASDPSDDGAQMVDASGRPQPLLAAYRADALRAALATIGDSHGASMRALTALLTLTAVPDATGLSQDADTWEDVAQLRRDLA